MPEPISSIAVFGLMVGGSTILTNLNRQNQSVSESGEYLYVQASHFKKYSTQPVSLDTNRYDAIADIEELLEEVSQDGWDGDSAPAVSEQTIANVKAFLSALPDDISDPEFAPEPKDGAISLEWYGGYRKIASVSIHDSQRVAFSALQGTDITNGAYRFNDDHIPAPLLSTIREIIA